MGERIRALEASRLYPSVGLGRADRGVARAAPGWRAGPRRPPAGGWRTSGAGCAARRRPGAPRGAPAPSRRRTSEVDSRRPLLERRSARSPVVERGPAAGEVGARARARRARRRGSPASRRPCPPPAAPRRRGRATRGRGSRAPRPAARPSRPARTSRGRAGRAARGRDLLEQLPHLARLEHARAGRRPCAGWRPAGPGWPRSRRAPRGGGRRPAPRRACAPPSTWTPALGQHAGEAAQLAVAQLGGPRSLALGPLGQLAQVHPVGAARLSRHPPRALPVVEAAQRARPA